LFPWWTSKPRQAVSRLYFIDYFILKLMSGRFDGFGQVIID